MTRKKYVKQLMALGMSRNSANVMARICQATGKSYAAEYRRQRPWLQLAHAARKAKAAVLNVAKAFNSVATAAAKLRENLVLHHATLITPDNLNPGNMVIVTRQEHDQLHGYSAKVSFVDEVHTWDPAEALKPIGKESVSCET